ncbi:MAG: MraY family glycosyltransferase [Armatimonadota bacterium]
MIWHILAFTFAILIAWFVTPRIRRIALRLNVVVQPGGRRVHLRPTPQWGGIAIFLGFLISSLLALKAYGRLDIQAIGLIVSGAIIVTVGMVDDMRELSAKVQIASIIIASIVMMTFGVRIQFITNPFDNQNMIVLSSVVSYIITLAWMFGVTKTVDFMDGLDGLAAGIGAIAAGTLAIMAYYAGQPHVALMSAALSGACIGFLRFNFNPAKIFMGTGGSQFIGFALATISIIGAFKIAAAMAIALPILVLGIPIFDGLFVMLRRLSKGQPMHIADKTHLHHRLLERGLSQKQAVIVIWTFCLLLCGTALFLLIRR